MKIVKTQRQEERSILTYMIVDKVVLGKIADKKLLNPFKTSWANLISSWCIKYFNKYEEAPGKQIESLYYSWTKKNKDENLSKLVETFLTSLSEEYEEVLENLNSDYVVDLAGTYFNRVLIENTIEEVSGNLDRGNVEEAQNNLLKFTSIEIGKGEGIDVFQDSKVIKEALEEQVESIIEYPGALGRFFKNELSRDGFVAFLGPEKRGKTWWLIDVAYRAMLQRRKVAFFEAGDMSKNQIMRRLMVRVCKRPLRATTITIPTSITMPDKENGDKCAVITSAVKKFDDRLSWGEAMKACEKLMRLKIKSKQPYFKLSCHPNSSLSVKGIKGILANWAREDWIPDVIVIDYADILDMNHPGKEGRDQINETWKQLRSLSQEYHCLVMTATQANSSSYSATTLSQNNFSDDKRKFAHVTGMIGLNAIAEEKKSGILRLNWIVLREDEFDVQRCVHVAGCLAIGNPAMKSCL